MDAAQRLEAVEQRLQELEHRLRVVEDRASIADLIAQYGPIVDSGEGKHLRNLWSAEGTYRVGEEYVFTAEELSALTELSAHQEYLTRGCAHFLSAPTIEVRGDEAVAVNYSVVLMREGESWVADRVSANRWNLQRTTGGWRVIDRSNALLDGGQRAREILATRFNLEGAEAVES